MNRKAFCGRLFRCILAGIALYAAFAMPAVCRSSVHEAFSLCVESLLPSLFPFLVVSSMIAESGAIRTLGIPLRFIAHMLHQPKACAGVLFIGIVGGFAPAAIGVAALYRRNELDSVQAAYLLPACICSAPSFIILTVGTEMLHSETLGFMLYLSQILSGFFSALVIRGFCGRTAPCAVRPAESSLPETDGTLYRAVCTSVPVFLQLCGFVIFFRFLSGSLAACLPARVSFVPDLLLEISSGCAAAAGFGRSAAYWCCAVLSLQSLSVILQVRAILPHEISLFPLLASRLLHLPFSLLFLSLFLRVCPAAAVYSSLTPRVIIMPRCPPECAVCLFLACCLLASRLCHTLQHEEKEI